MEKFVTKEIKRESLESLKELVRIPSINDLSEVVSFPPFGVEIDDALNKTIEICEKLGLETYKDPEGNYGYAEYGEGDETLGVLCHLDVVPPGNEKEWEIPPFEPTEKNGYLYGRGTQDDKGPTISALYAFKAVVDKYKQFNRKIRFIFGLDEEMLWRSIGYYKHHEKRPDFGFVPDSKFPVINTERQLLRVKLVGPGSPELQINCGGTFNVVPDVATYRGGKADYLVQALEKLGASFDQDESEVTVYGKSVHANRAYEGVNAITLLSKGLVTFSPHPAVGFIGEKIGLEANGAKIFKGIKEDIFGEIIFNMAGLTIDEDHSEILIDIRMPLEATKEEVIDQLKKVIDSYSLEYSEHAYLPSIYNAEDSELVQTLLSVYQETTGRNENPEMSGGATYARSMKNFIAFGALFPESEYNAHQTNESIHIEKDFYGSMEIYAETIYRLCVDV